MSEPSAMNRRRGTRGPLRRDEVNLRDVAQHAGVSPATASRVFSGHGSVNEETRARVLASAEELGYVVNSLAQAATGSGHRFLALVTSDLAGSSEASFAAGAEAVATRNGNPFMVSLTHGKMDREREIIETACTQRAAGVLLMDSATSGKDSQERIAAYSSMLRAVGAQLVLCGHPHLPSQPTVLTVNYDQIGGVRRAITHLTDKGHTRIAFLGWANSTTVGQRFLGYLLGLRDAGLNLDSSLIIECPDEVIEAHLAGLLLLRGYTPPTAIVCLTDTIATGVYRAARDFGISIPYQLAVTGFGDSSFAGDLSPALTSIQAPFHDLGVRGARLALGLADEDPRGDLPTKLIQRGSTA